MARRPSGPGAKFLRNSEMTVLLLFSVRTASSLTLSGRRISSLSQSLSTSYNSHNICSTVFSVDFVFPSLSFSKLEIMIGWFTVPLASLYRNVNGLL